MKITIKELAEQIAEHMKKDLGRELTEAETKKAEEAAAAKVEEAKKAEEEAAKKAEAEEAEKKLNERISTAVEIAMKKVQGIKGAADNGAGTAPEPGTQSIGAPGIISSRFKLDKESQKILDAITSQNIPGNGFEMKFDLSVADGEDRLRYAYRKAAAEGRKADIDGSSSYGAELLPENWGTDFYMRMADMHGDLMRFFPKVGMTTYKQHISELLADITVAAYYSYANQVKAIENVTASAPTTGDLSLEARTFVAKTNVYDRMDADVKVRLVRGIRQKMSEAMASKVSAAILNGDTTATHMDQDLEAAGANIPEAMWKGLRKLIMAGSLGVDGDSTYTLANLDSALKLMGKYAIANRGSVIGIFGTKAYNTLLGLYRASSSTPRNADFVLDKGVITNFMGHPVVVSQHQREDLEIDGYQDETGTSGAQGFISFANVNEFVMGIREQISIQVVPDPLNARRVLQATALMDFQPFETPSTTISTCAGVYAFTA